MGSFSIWHWLIVLVIVLLVFGTKKLAQHRFRPRWCGEGLQGRHEGGVIRRTGDACSRRSTQGQTIEGEAREGRPEPVLSLASRASIGGALTGAPFVLRRAGGGPCLERAHMFDFGFSELVVIGIVMLIVVGPSACPRSRAPPGTCWARATLRLRRQVRHPARDAARGTLKKLQEQVRHQSAQELERRCAPGSQGGVRNRRDGRRGALHPPRVACEPRRHPARLAGAPDARREAGGSRAGERMRRPPPPARNPRAARDREDSAPPRLERTRSRHERTTGNLHLAPGRAARPPDPRAARDRDRLRLPDALGGRDLRHPRQSR